MDKICDSKINDNVISGLYNLLKTEHDNAEVFCPQVVFFWSCFLLYAICTLIDSLRLSAPTNTKVNIV